MEESEAVRWIGEYCVTQGVKIDADASRELVDALGGDMMMVSNEIEKLMLYVGEKKHITLGDVETMVLAAKQRSLYELTDAISAKDRVRALEMLDAILTTGDGDVIGCAAKRHVLKRAAHIFSLRHRQAGAQQHGGNKREPAPGGHQFHCGSAR